MGKFVIEGGRPLSGTVTPSGNKNAALKLIPACLLTDQPVILHNVPEIGDVLTTIEIMSDLGVAVSNLGNGSWSFHAENIEKTTLNEDLARRIRASFVFSGPMLARLGHVRLPGPGGDIIGGRPLDTHVRGLKSLGVAVSMDERGSFVMSAPMLKGGGYVLQAEASVTATENTVMAAVLARGETVLDNAAREPHTQDLCNFLNKLGANVEGVGTSRLLIQGVEKLHGGEFTIGPDYMEIGSLIGAAAVTRGQVRIKDVRHDELQMIRLTYGRLGVGWVADGNDIVVDCRDDFEIEAALGGRIPEIKPHPWPGFPPDLMSIAVVMATQAEGSVLLHDWMYESRFYFVDKLLFMGAKIVLCDPHRVLVQGRSALYANPTGVTSPDIRAGMTMVLAALCARGTSTISNIGQIERGYERVDEKLQALGASITRLVE